MSFGEWKARIVEEPYRMGFALYLHRVTPGGIKVLNHKGILKLIKQGGISTEDDYFARFESQEQLQSIADAFSQFGVKTNNDHKNEGLLEATKAHLFDMRAIAYSKLGLMFEDDTKERPNGKV